MGAETRIRGLLVEDNPVDAVALRYLVAKVRNPPRLEHVETLNAALTHLGDGDFDVVILDLSLPDSDGLDTLEAVLTTAPGVPVVVLTGTDDEGVCAAALEAGAQDYIAKDRLEAHGLMRALRYAIDRERTQRQLAEQHAVLSSVLESLADGVVVVDPAGVVRLANPAGTRLLGARPGDLQTPAEGGWLLPDQATPCPDADRPLARAARGESIDGVEIYARETSRSGRWLSANIRPLADGQGGVAVLRDVTEQRIADERVRMLNTQLMDEVAERTRALAKLEAADRVKQQFLDVVSHELRTPLTPILGYARLLLRRTQTLTPQQREGIELISESAKRLYKVVESILDFQQLRAEGVGWQTEPTHVDSLLRRLEESARVRLGERPVTLHFELADDLPETLMLDSAHTHQILEKLLDNAIQFTDEGQIDVTARWDAATRRFEVAVRDTGIGIAPGHHELVFGAFHQAEPALTRKHGGLGLGLAHARFLSEALGGGIELDSEPGVGSTFTLDLPAPRLENV